MKKIMIQERGNTMKTLMVLFVVAVMSGCAGTPEQIQESVNNRPSICDNVESGESNLCASAAAINARGVPFKLDDVGLMVRSGVPAYIIIKERKNPEERARLKQEAIKIVKEVKAISESGASGTTDMTGLQLLSLINTKNETVALVGLATSEALKQLLSNPAIASVALTPTDWKIIGKLCDETLFNLEFVPE